MVTNRQIVKCKELEETTQKTADYICRQASIAISQTGRFSIALSGGKSPKQLYQILATPKYGQRIEWNRVHFFWGDERCVPTTHPDSNYRMAFDALLSKIGVPEENIHRIPAELGLPENVAAVYADHLKKFFTNPSQLFDLTLLGMGPDGHTASIFPGSALDEKKMVVAAIAPKGMAIKNRITLSISAINRSKSAAFLISGSDKAEVVKDILSGGSPVELKYPAAMVKPIEELVWFLNEDDRSPTHPPV